MELRKVQLTGGSSLTVTLPKPWAEKVDLEPGDVVGCAEQLDGSLAVRPHAKGDREVQRYHIDSEEASSEFLFRRLIAAYLSGYDVIEVGSEKTLQPEARQAIRKAVTRIMGLEVIEGDENRMTIQDFLDPKEFHMDKALRRISMLTRSMQRQATDLMQGSEAEDLEMVEERDDEVDRLHWLVNKQFHALLRDVSYSSRMELSASEAVNFLFVARMSERAADHAARVAQEAGRIRRTAEREEFLDSLAGTWRGACTLYEDAIDTFLGREPEAADRVIQRANDLQQDEQAAYLRRATDFGADAVGHFAFIIESIGRTAAYAANIAEIAINHEVAQPGTTGPSSEDQPSL